MQITWFSVHQQIWDQVDIRIEEHSIIQCKSYTMYGFMCVCLHESTCTACMQRPGQVRWGPSMPWNWSYRGLWTETRYFAGAASTLQNWPTSLLCKICFVNSDLLVDTSWHQDLSCPLKNLNVSEIWSIILIYILMWW